MFCYVSYRYGRALNVSYGPTVTNIEKMGHLVSLRTNWADILSEDWTWGTGLTQQKIIYVVKGDALLACDVHGAKVLEKDDRNRRAVIQLPAPKVLSPRINHHQSGPYDSSFWITPEKRDAMTQHALEKGQDRIAQAAGCEENIAAAKANARQVLTALWEIQGWNVEVVFDDEKR